MTVNLRFLLTALTSTATFAAVIDPPRPGQSSGTAVVGDSFRTVEFETDEGTEMNVDVSPDGREIAFDLLGDIYLLPISGGEAKPLVTGRSWDLAPRYAPDGSRILFVSDRGDGLDALWTVDRSGKHPAKIASGDSARFTTPIWSHDGREIVAGWGAAFDLGSRPVIVNVKRGTIDTIAGPRSTVFTASLSRDGRHLFFSGSQMGGRSSAVIRYDRETRQQLVLSDTALQAHDYNPTVSRTGQWLGYFRYTRDGRTALRVRHLEQTIDRELLVLTDGDDPSRVFDDEAVRPNMAFTPGDSAIVLWTAGKLWRVPLDGGAPILVPFRAKIRQQIVPAIRPTQVKMGDTVRARGIRTAGITPDGRQLVFSAVGKVWVDDVATGRVERLTNGRDFEIFPVISPDGRSVAFLAYTDTLQGVAGKPWRRSRIMLARLATLGAAAQVLTPEPDDFEPPVWYPGSDRLLSTLRVKEKYGSRVAISVDTNGRGPVELPFSLTRSGCAERDVNTRSDMRITAEGRLYYIVCTGTQLEPGTTTIASIQLDRVDHQVHLTVNAGVLVSSISPDGRWVIVSPFMTRGGAYLLEVPAPGARPDTVTLGSNEAKLISRSAITAAAWQNERVAITSLGRSIAKVDVSGRTDPSFHTVRLDLPRFEPSGTLAIRGARLLTMAGPRNREKVIERGTLVMTGGRIVAVGPESEVKVPSGATVIDGAGLTIMPGIIDVHEHAVNHLSGVAPLLDPNMIDLLSYGITSAFNPQTRWTEAEAEAQEISATADLPRVRHFYSGRGVTPRDNDILGDESANRAVELLEVLGVPVVKEYLQPSREQRRSLARAAARRGLGITSHTAGLQRTLTLAVDGFTGWEHFYMITPFYQDVTKLIAATGINVTANISTNQMTSNPAGSSAIMYLETANQHPGDTAKTFRFSYRAARDRNRDVKQPAGVFDFVARMPELPFDQIRQGRTSRAVTSLINAGGTVSIGAHDPPAIRTHWEMWMIRRGGASAMDVLRAATINGAKKIGVDSSLGSLEVGKFADLLVLSGNPLENIENTVNIKYVVANGVLYDDESMTQLWPTYRPLPRMGWQTEEVYRQMPKATPLGK